jgi:alpha-glucosidase
MGRGFILLVALWPAACCVATDQATAVVDGDDVVVNASSVRITRGGREVLLVGVQDIGVKKGAAFYDMQFGMFDIREDDDAFVFGSALRVTESTDKSVSFDVVVDEDAIASGSVRGDGGGLLLQIDASGDDDRVIVTTSCAPDHHFLGLGAQTHDVDHRGQIVPLWVSEQGVGKADSDELPVVWQLLGRRHTTHVPMPAFVRSDAVAVVVDTSAFSRFDLCATAEALTSFEVWEPSARLRIFARDSVRRAQQAMTGFLGRPRVLPPWALAPWNDAIFSADDVAAFAAFLRAEEIPSSVLWSEDWRGGRFSGDTYRLDEDWRLDAAQYPDYPALIDTLTSSGFVHQLYFNTFLTNSGDVFDEVTSAGHDLRLSSTGGSALFAGADRDFSPTALLDLTNPAARTYMKEEHLKPTLALGARSWMADFAEWMPVDDIALASGEDPALVHNRYPELWQSLNREALEEAGVVDDGVVFVRSGHLKSPPLTDVLWAGDQRTSFDDDDGLPTVLPIGIGAATTGFAFFTHDIGGYQSSTNDPTTKELWFRWTELGAFTPVMRTHHGTHAALNHNLRTDLESTAHWKRYAEIHVRLYPYLRALMIAATRDDGGDDDDDDGDVGAGLGPLPMWVPLPLLFASDPEVWSIKDEVMLGPSLLIAPVVVEGALTRSVMLPGGRWVAFPMPGAPAGSLGASRAEFSGPVVVDVDAALGEIPVFMPAGAIVPLTALPAQTLREVAGDAIADLSSTNGDRVVVVALGAAGVFVEEDGSSYTLDGDGLTPPFGVDGEGGIDVVGDTQLTAPGLTFTLRAHPATRTTRVLFRGAKRPWPSSLPLAAPSPGPSPAWSSRASCGATRASTRMRSTSSSARSRSPVSSSAACSRARACRSCRPAWAGWCSRRSSGSSSPTAATSSPCAASGRRVGSCSFRWCPWPPRCWPRSSSTSRSPRASRPGSW